MPHLTDGRIGRRLWVAAVAIAAMAGVIALRGTIVQVGALAMGACAMCFMASPLARLCERRFSRPAAALAALAALFVLIIGLAWLLLPAMLRELTALAQTLPDTLGQVTAWADGLRMRLMRRLPGIALPGIDLSALQGMIAGIAGGTVSLAVNLADVFGRVSMMAVLAYFLLRDRDRLLLRLELLVPLKARPTAVRMGNAICRELGLYVRGQLAVALAVAVLSVVALSIVGVRSALALGPIIGILNMVPYFGPFIGGVPAVLIALGDGWQKAALTVLALTVVQQLDGSWISPRIMGSLTGFSPALVLVGIYAGARLGGIAGMLLALPLMISCRTLFRIFVQKCENN